MASFRFLSSLDLSDSTGVYTCSQNLNHQNRCVAKIYLQPESITLVRNCTNCREAKNRGTLQIANYSFLQREEQLLCSPLHTRSRGVGAGAGSYRDGSSTSAQWRGTGQRGLLAKEGQRRGLLVTAQAPVERRTVTRLGGRGGRGGEPALGRRRGGRGRDPPALGPGGCGGMLRPTSLRCVRGSGDEGYCICRSCGPCRPTC
jgi:hypothetical protein